MIEVLKEAVKNGGDSLLDILERELDCDYCPFEKKCNAINISCKSYLKRYVELE